MVAKIRNSLFVALLLLVGFSYNVFAAGLDPTMKGSAELDYQYEDKEISNTTVSLYRIATVDTLGTYHYTESFQDRTEKLNGLSASETRQLAKTLADLVQKNQIKATYQARTSSSGYLKVNDLETGVYLVLTDPLEEDYKQYVTLPFLLAIPQTEDSAGGFIYDVSVDVKVELIEQQPPSPTSQPTPSNSPTPSPTPTQGNNTTNSPSTYDAIVVYVGILAMSIIGVVIIVYYINRKKKGSNKDEN